MPSEPLDLPDVVAQGDYRSSLIALRDVLADGVAQATGQRLIHRAPLAKQLADVLKAIDEMPNGVVADSVDLVKDAIERKLRAV